MAEDWAIYKRRMFQRQKCNHCKYRFQWRRISTDYADFVIYAIAFSYLGGEQPSRKISELKKFPESVTHLS